MYHFSKKAALSVCMLTLPLSPLAHALSTAEAIWGGLFCGVLAYGVTKHKMWSNDTLIANAAAHTEKLRGYIVECSPDAVYDMGKNIMSFRDEQPMVELMEEFRNALSAARTITKELTTRNLTHTPEYIELVKITSKASIVYEAVLVSESYADACAFQYLCEDKFRDNEDNN